MESVAIRGKEAVYRLLLQHLQPEMTASECCDSALRAAAGLAGCSLVLQLAGGLPAQAQCNILREAILNCFQHASFESDAPQHLLQHLLPLLDAVGKEELARQLLEAGRGCRYWFSVRSSVMGLLDTLSGARQVSVLVAQLQQAAAQPELSAIGQVWLRDLRAQLQQLMPHSQWASTCASVLNTGARNSSHGFVVSLLGSVMEDMDEGWT
mmetsp:Transcript_35975/g.90858  ORF Transcript_35975/g.90858 Transcript_35975/m.90858 type:complete len:210 (-) Transcript_35975:231-860(-)